MRRTLNIRQQTLLHTCNSLHKFNTAGIKGWAGGGFNGLLLEMGAIMRILLPPEAMYAGRKGAGRALITTGRCRLLIGLL